MTRIGFIGLGHMGAPMAKNLIKAGHKLTVYDVNTLVTEQIAQAGARQAQSVAELSKDQEIIITMLQTGNQVIQVCTGPLGIYANAAPGTLHIDCSTIDVSTSRTIHSQAKQAGLLSLDAPVSGGVLGANNASLTFMVGGDALVFNQALTILQVMGKKVIHAGASGNGQVAKICNNMILGVSMIAVSEAFILGEKLGLDPKKLFEISSNSSGQCWAMTSYCPVPGVIPNVPSNNDYQPGFTAQMMLKDLNLSQDAARNIAQHTPLGSMATELYAKFVSHLDSEIDFSGIIKMLAEQNEVAA